MDIFIWAAKGYLTFCAAIGMSINLLVVYYLLAKKKVSDRTLLREGGFEFFAAIFTIAIAYVVIISVLSFVEPKETSSSAISGEPVSQQKGPAFDFESTGQFGDSFGFLNALLAIFIAGTAIETYKAQREQLNTQNQQLADERKARIVDHVSQRFYALLNAYREMVSAVSFMGWRSDSNQSGLAALLVIENELLGSLTLDGSFRNLSTVRSELSRTPDLDASIRAGALLYHRVRLNHNVEVRSLGNFDPLSRHEVSTAFRAFFELVIGAHVGHLLRTQIEIIRFIDDRLTTGAIDDAVAESFIETFRTMLSDPEMHLLLYFALYDANDDEVIRLVDRHRLLFNLLTKAPEFVIHRIPELSYFPLTLAEWNRRRNPIQ